MKKNIKILMFFVAIVLLTQNSFAQKNQPDAVFKAAEKEYNALRYAYAIPLLEQVLKAQPNNDKAVELLANAYRKVKDYRNAATWYAKLVTQKPLKPEWVLANAEVLANNKDYTASQTWYNEYLTLTGADNNITEFAKAYQSNSFLNKKNSWAVAFANINTAQSEYAPTYYKDGLLFVSNRKVNGLTKNVFAWDQTPFSDLYFVDKLDKIKAVNVDSVMLAAKSDKTLQKKFYAVNSDDTRKTSNDSEAFVDSYPVLNDTLAKTLGAENLASRLKGNVNSKYHEGPVALLPDGKMIFTRNNYYRGKTGKSTDGIIKLKLYTASTAGMDDVQPFAYNNDEYSVGHPALNSAGTVLVFASDMPGGLGGSDLYYSTRAKVTDEWSKPVNMGSAVNTKGDELFPTIYQDNQLYFSSTGHVGLGGLDIFEIALEGITPKGSPVNLGAPVNSSVDDFSFVRNASGENGFFTSNRRGNDDIYTLSYRKFNIILKGMLTDKTSGQALRNINIGVAHGNQQLNIKTDAQGNYSYQLPQNSLTKLSFNVPNYAGKQISISTDEINVDTVIVKNIALNQIGQADTKNGNETFKNSCDSLKQLMKDFVIYYDLDKSIIRKDATELTNKLAVFLKANPQFEIAAASYCDSRASEDYNIRLSQRRSQAAKNYLVNKGIGADRIKISFHGEENLVNNCTDGVACSEEQQQLNRRTEFFLLYKGKKIEEIDCDVLKKLK